MVSACIQKIKLVNLASDPVEFPVKVLYRRRVALLEFVGQESETRERDSDFTKPRERASRFSLKVRNYFKLSRLLALVKSALASLIFSRLSRLRN